MLEVKNLAVTYGRHRALEGVSARVAKGEICVILGANGAGKSTLLKAIAGMVHADHGSEIVMNGTPITAMKPHRIVEQGIALVPEGRGIFGDLTVAENLQLGAFAGRARRDEAATLDLIYRLFPRLAERRRQVARTMSGGEQQMVAIGRALMSKPEILMLDEPSLGLSPLLTQELFRSLKEIAATGVGILLVEQNARQSLKIAARGYLIENGAVRGENNAAALMRDPAVINAYLGGAGGHAGGRAAIALPQPMRLPGQAGAMGALLSDLAARAGRIQNAFVRAMRQGEELPSAFVGRYDPKTAGDPWKQMAQEEAARPASPAAPPKVSADARRVGDLAAALALRAGDRLALHVRSARLSGPRPSAFLRTAGERAEDAARFVRRAADEAARSHIPAHGGLDLPRPAPALQPASPSEASPARETGFADLAARAAERSAAFVRARRAAAPQPAAFATQLSARPVPAGKRPGNERLNGAHGLIGHNSGGIAIEPELPATGPGDAGRPAAGRREPGLSIADMAARAASVHAAHVAAQRKSLSAFVIPAEPAAPRMAKSAKEKAGAQKLAKPEKSRKSAGKKRKKKHKET